MELAFAVVMLAAIAVIPAMVGFGAARWCLKRRWRPLVVLAAAALGVVAIYGLLRLTGAVVFPTDQNSSMFWFGYSCRDDGFHYLYWYGALLTGAVVALAGEKRAPERGSMSVNKTIPAR